MKDSHLLFFSFPFQILHSPYRPVFSAFSSVASSRFDRFNVFQTAPPTRDKPYSPIPFSLVLSNVFGMTVKSEDEERLFVPSALGLFFSGSPEWSFPLLTPSPLRVFSRTVLFSCRPISVHARISSSSAYVILFFSLLPRRDGRKAQSTSHFAPDPRSFLFPCTSCPYISIFISDGGYSPIPNDLE